MQGIYSRLAELIKANKPVALATVLGGEKVGAKLLVPGEGEVEGGIDADVEERVAADARQLLGVGRNETRTYEVKGEVVEVFIETFPPPERLVIIGAVHVAIPLHRLGKQLGYHVTVVDARGFLATRERFPEADQIIVAWPDEAMSQLAIDSGTSVVVLTHDLKFDAPALVSALRSNARYIGAIGSRTTNEQRFAALREEGLSEEELGRIYAPVGLDIGGRTPAEIALAILAEVVAARYGREGGHLREEGRRRKAEGGRQ